MEKSEMCSCPMVKRNLKICLSVSKEYINVTDGHHTMAKAMLIV